MYKDGNPHLGSCSSGHEAWVICLTKRLLSAEVLSGFSLCVYMPLMHVHTKPDIVHKDKLNLSFIFWDGNVFAFVRLL